MEHPYPVPPDDIIEDIFTRLPARKALECRRLSRVWAAVLSSDEFVDRHRRAGNRTGGPQVLPHQLFLVHHHGVRVVACLP